MGCTHNRILTPAKGAVLLTGLSYHSRLCLGRIAQFAPSATPNRPARLSPRRRFGLGRVGSRDQWAFPESPRNPPYYGTAANMAKKMRLTAIIAKHMPARSNARHSPLIRRFHVTAKYGSHRTCIPTAQDTTSPIILPNPGACSMNARKPRLSVIATPVNRTRQTWPMALRRGNITTPTRAKHASGISLPRQDLIVLGPVFLASWFITEYSNCPCRIAPASASLPPLSRLRQRPMS